MAYLDTVQVWTFQENLFANNLKRTLVKTLEKKLSREPERIPLLKDFLMGIGKRQ